MGRSWRGCDPWAAKVNWDSSTGKLAAFPGEGASGSRKKDVKQEKKVSILALSEPKWL
jgi:hypothetical protein